jgi:SAM-dependent methyltransferase
VGLGTGALPAYIAHHRAGLGLATSHVAAVEIDPVVVRAAAQHLGCCFTLVDAEATAQTAAVEASPLLPPDSGRGGFCVTLSDAAAYMPQLRPQSVSAIFLDAFDGAGETPPHLKSEGFLRSCHDALAPGGVLVLNLFNGAEGSEARAAFDAMAVRLQGAVGLVYSLQVVTQEESVVLVARRGGEGVAPPPGAADLRAAARDVAFAARMRQLDAAALVGRLLRVEVHDTAEGAMVQEVVPPAASTRDDWRPARPKRSTSACERLRAQHGLRCENE